MLAETFLDYLLGNVELQYQKSKRYVRSAFEEKLIARQANTCVQFMWHETTESTFTSS